MVCVKQFKHLEPVTSFSKSKKYGRLKLNSGLLKISRNKYENTCHLTFLYNEHGKHQVQEDKHSKHLVWNANQLCIPIFSFQETYGDDV